MFNEDEVLKRIHDGRIIFGKSGNTRPVQKVFASNRDLTQKPETWFDKQGYNSDGMLTMAALLGKKVFDYPKPIQLIEYILRFATENNSIVLDSFGGSGTTAHSVIDLNKRDGGNRKFICVELMDYADTITAERVKRVIKGYGEGKNAVEGTSGSFSFYELGEPLLIGENLNENIGTDKIKEYIWYTETKADYQENDNGNEFYLGRNNDTDYYFFYNKNCVTTLDHTFLATIKQKAEGYVIYADLCSLSDDELSKFNIIFKKIPRDITRF